MLEQARTIYNECIDIDFMDYEETQEQDIDYIAGLIAKHGFNKALKMCIDRVSW